MAKPFADITALICAIAVFSFSVWRGEHPNLVELIILGATLRISARQDIF
jgi:hypothetical protein